MPLSAETFSLLMRMRILIKKEFGTAPTLQEDDVVGKYYQYGMQSQQPDLIKLTAQLAVLKSRPAEKSLQPEPVHTTLSIVAETTKPVLADDASPELSSTTAVGLLIRMRPLLRKEFGVTPPLHGRGAIEKYYRYGKQSQQPELRQLAQELDGVVSRAGGQVGATAVSTPLTRPVDTSFAASLPSVPSAPSVASVQPEQSAPDSAVAVEEAPAGTAPDVSEHDNLLELFISDLVSQPVQVLCHAVPPFILDTPRQRCLLRSVFKGLLPLQHVERSAVRVEPVSLDTVATFEKRANIVSLEAFLWFCGSQLSHGTLLPSLQTRQSFQLNKWPDFGKLPYTRGHMRLATLLWKAPYSLTNLINSAGVPYAETVTFLNAAFLCRWLQEDMVVTSSSATPSPSSNPERRGLISRIRERLGLTR